LRSARASYREADQRRLFEIDEGVLRRRHSALGMGGCTAIS